MNDSVNYTTGEVVAFIDRDQVKFGIVLDEDPENEENDLVVHQLGTISDTNPLFRPIYEDTKKDKSTIQRWDKPLATWKPLLFDTTNDQVVHRHIEWRSHKTNKDKGRLPSNVLKRLRGPLITGESFPLHIFQKGKQATSKE